MLKYRVKTGIVDAAGARHKIGAFVKLDSKDLTQIFQAMYLFQVVGIGIEFPNSAMAQFNAGQPWDVVPGAQIEGGHYIPCLAKRLENIGTARAHQGFRAPKVHLQDGVVPNRLP